MGYVTTIDPDTGRVDVPLNMDLEWFDAFRQGLVGIVSLVPAECDDGTWMLTYAEAPAVTQAHVEAAMAEEDE